MKANPNICWNSRYTAIDEVIHKHVFFPAVNKCQKSHQKVQRNPPNCKTWNLSILCTLSNFHFKKIFTCGWRQAWLICVHWKTLHSTDLLQPRSGSEERNGSSSLQIQSRKADMLRAGLSLIVVGAVL